MKRVLITGANSYVGTNVEKWLMKEPENFYVETLDMRDPNWKNFDFSKFDVVFHVAGIAHIKETKKNKALYYKVNRDLAIETARISKVSGVKKFVFMSSLSVYGKHTGVIGKDTIENPVNTYGLTKLSAEEGIIGLSDYNFTVNIVRAPIIYGVKSPGNFSKLIKKSRYFFVLPLIKNKKSMLYICNLCVYVEKIISGDIIQQVVLAQNPDYVSTNDIIKTYRLLITKKNRESRILGFILKIGILMKNKVLLKLYGDLYIDNIGIIPNLIDTIESFQQIYEKDC